METLVIKTKGDKLKALKAFLSALEIPFQNQSLESNNNEFTANLQKAEEDLKAGRLTKIKSKEELHSFLEQL